MDQGVINEEKDSSWFGGNVVKLPQISYCASQFDSNIVFFLNSKVFDSLFRTISNECDSEKR